MPDIIYRNDAITLLTANSDSLKNIDFDKSDVFIVDMQVVSLCLHLSLLCCYYLYMCTTDFFTGYDGGIGGHHCVCIRACMDFGSPEYMQRYNVL